MSARSGWCLRRVLERQPHADGIAVIFHFCGKRVKNIDMRPSSSIMRGCAVHPHTPLFLFLLVQIVRKIVLCSFLIVPIGKVVFHSSSLERYNRLNLLAAALTSV
jgi:hypothetical protein